MASYQDRRRRRIQHVQLVNAELREWRVQRRKDEEVGSNTDTYIKANSDGWPDGYSGLFEDDLSNWDVVWPGSSVRLAD
ncbi:MAG: hypothetical protein QOI13_68 [Paraburkholderia sp.]|nr:hypothetical protein [Paraburkholderia sp.]